MPDFLAETYTSRHTRAVRRRRRAGRRASQRPAGPALWRV